MVSGAIAVWMRSDKKKITNAYNKTRLYACPILESKNVLVNIQNPGQTNAFVLKLQNTKTAQDKGSYSEGFFPSGFLPNLKFVIYIPISYIQLLRACFIYIVINSNLTIMSTLNVKMSETDQNIRKYFQLGFSNKKILAVLAHFDGIIISHSTLKRKLKSIGLFQRKKHSNLLDVACFILRQLDVSGSLHGYRWMHLKCKHSGFNIPRDTVYFIMKLLDPKGIRQYLCPGPNFVWHVDSYDKLKPFGIAINGCIDGYSRCVIWLEAATTNSNPRVIANYYINSVRKKGGCPKRIRSDLGTENGYIADMQKFLRRDHGDTFSGERSFLYGKSTHNQRIEWFWGLLRKEMGQCFMDFFAEFGNDLHDLYCGDFLDKNLIQFCFLKIIQADLDDAQGIWITHVLQSKNAVTGGGRRPILMYTLPQFAEDHICPANENEVTICEEQTLPKTLTCADETVFQLCTLFMEENNLSFPQDSNQANDLYIRLREWIRLGLDLL
ncbi:LOW QUALITY PROTEIN: hypothetical protein KUTeg_003833 [Tegillarca granosa]|uniref:Integrase core domain-containing protein n=1 Tax=Tegillarca granosa TaxID=220873 RepID=A0ABQ9FN90_TEGGR|nr:LOW QUALITY PROTEIN: hypothetical protein KUTeg_003833 [Tegillarca granosa]